MKNIKLILVAFFIFIAWESNYDIYANGIELNKNIENKTSYGEKYEIHKKDKMVKFKLEDTDMPKEAIDDLNALYDIQYLKLKTNSNYEVALAYENGEYTYVDSVDTIEQAIDIAKKLENNVDKEVIPAVVDKDGLVVYATNAIGRIVKVINGKPVVDGSSNYNKYTANLYKTEKSTSKHTYINHSYIDDVPIIEDNGTRVKIQVNGFIGWMDKKDSTGLNIISVPLNQTKNLSYFMKDNNGTLKHYISFDVEQNGKGNTREIGVAPSFMEVGKKYYSYDGKYFYNSISTLLQDLSKNSYNNSVNKSKPYYNYYTYIPGRHKSSFTVSDMNNYIANNTPSDSVLRNKGKAFLDAQNNYGVSANIILGIAMNESGRGTSSLAKQKNNIFGLNAVDSSPGQSANYFKSIEACIDDFAKNWMNNDYFNPKSWKYNGSNLGNKENGLNVMYASDPYWGEKAADFIHDMDEYLSGKELSEYNKYQLGIYKATDSIKDSKGNTLYTISSNRSNNAQIGDSLVITNDSSNKVELYPDRQVPISQTNPLTYNWNTKGYVNSSSITLINNVMKDFTNFTVNNVNITSTSVSGKGVEGANVKVYVNGNKVGSTVTVDSNNNYKITIPRQKLGSKVTVVINKDGYNEAKKSFSVLNVLNTLTINNVNSSSTTITGNGTSGATVKAYVGSKQIGNTQTINSSGSYSINIPSQNHNTKIEVKMSKSGYDTLSKSTIVSEVILKTEKILTKDIYKYDAGTGKYLTYINGKGYSQYSYLNKSGTYAFTPSSWMKATGLDITMPNSTNGYIIGINNNYMLMYNDTKNLLDKLKQGKISQEEAMIELSRIKEQINQTEITVNDLEEYVDTKSSVKTILTNDIYKYNAGSEKYLTYINGKGYSQYSYLNKSGNYAFTPSSWMVAAGLEVTMPTSSNGYTMKINNPYITKYNNIIKDIKTYM